LVEDDINIYMKRKIDVHQIGYGFMDLVDEIECLISEVRLKNGMCTRNIRVWLINSKNYHYSSS